MKMYFSAGCRDYSNAFGTTLIWSLPDFAGENLQLHTRITSYNVCYTKLLRTQEDLSERVNKYIDGIDPIGKTHIREGVVVRVENSDKFKVFKSKNVSFKILEGIIKSEDIVNIEEQESSGSRIL